MIQSDSLLKSKMDMLIEKINDLQDVCTANNITHKLDLPQIVVIGSQSSGKSSVLENIVGRDFLPRGVGIVTRRPLILQLIYSGKYNFQNQCKDSENKNIVSKQDPLEYAVFNHKPETKFTDFNLVKQEIIDETLREIKSKNDVSEKPITLKLYSPRVLTLTLIDLPGLVKIATSDQPKNICMKIEQMCRNYIINKNAIILAVSNANIDISNSDALQLARSVDPNYDRTIGVLTKIDLMDHGTDVINILSGRIIKLRLGFIPIVSRSQSDIEKRKDINLALEDEKKFFSSHNAYKTKSIYCGTGYLISKLNLILHEHIKLCLPDLQEKINCLLQKNQFELQNLGFVNLSPKEMILKIINDITRKFEEIMNGQLENNKSEIVGGARIIYTFNEYFSRYLNNINPLESINDDQIRILLYNSSGSATSLVIFPNAAFERLAKTSIKTLQPHVTKLVSVIFSEIVKIIHQSANSTSLSRYPVLQEKITHVLINLFKKKTEETTIFVNTLVECNIDYLNSNFVDFQKWCETVIKETESSSQININESSSILNEMPSSYGKNNKITFDTIPSNLKISGSYSGQELIKLKTIKSLVISYFDETRKTILDQVPKAIMSQLVIKGSSSMQSVLFKEIYESDGIDQLVKESIESVERRKKVESNIVALKQAYDIMCTI